MTKLKENPKATDLLTRCFTSGSDLDTVPVRDTRSRNGTPDSGWDDYDDDLDLGLGKFESRV